MHNKRNNKESKTYVQGLRSFSNTLPRGVKGILKKNGYNYSEIISKWNILVGKDLSNFTFPRSIKMTNGNQNGTLIISVKRGNEVNVEYSKNEIINKINSYFGYKLISKIILKTFNSDEKKIKNITILKDSSQNLKKKINEVKSENIKNSLHQLLRAIQND